MKLILSNLLYTQHYYLLPNGFIENSKFTKRKK